jgi:uncharacterized protein YbjT (DUF2867 family)
MTAHQHENGSTATQRDPSPKTILVIGATGQQGGAVASALLKKGWPVRAFVRDPHGSKALALAAAGAALVQGDLSDSASLKRAMHDVYGVFSVQPSSGQGPAYGVSDEDEVRYGKAVADAATAARVRHFIYTSVNAAGPEKTGMGHFDSKFEIEAYIRSLDLNSTIVRPAGFMELLMLPGMGLDKGSYTSFLRLDQKAQFIAAQDIGKIVATLFMSGPRFFGQTIEIAGDETTGKGLQDSLSKAAGKPIAYQRFPDSLLRGNPFLAHLVALVEGGRLAGNADLAYLKSEFGPLLTFDEWLAGPGRPLLQAALDADDAPIMLR